MAFSWQDAWAGLPPRERAELMARQGHRYPLLEGLDVAVEAEAGGEAAGGEAAGGEAAGGGGLGPRWRAARRDGLALGGAVMGRLPPQSRRISPHLAV